MRRAAKRATVFRVFRRRRVKEREDGAGGTIVRRPPSPAWSVGRNHVGIQKGPFAQRSQALHNNAEDKFFNQRRDNNDGQYKDEWSKYGVSLARMKHTRKRVLFRKIALVRVVFAARLQVLLILPQVEFLQPSAPTSTGRAANSSVVS